MKLVSIKSLVFPEVKVIRYERFSDNRGYFTEPFRRSDFDNHHDMSFLHGVTFVQQNESYSKSYVIRGLHFQWNPFMGKLVRTLYGHMIDIFCDIRKGSPNFGRIAMYDMPADNQVSFGEWIWIPPGFAHGNYFLQDTGIEYMCSGEYSQGCEAGLFPLSDDLNWSFCEEKLKNQLFNIADRLNISEKDKKGLTLTSWEQDPRSDNFIYGKI
jgi:dTDP-4-dehydrorhamnose 3,5-epimerase